LKELQNSRARRAARTAELGELAKLQTMNCDNVAAELSKKDNSDN
jgi:hypothetical protein